MISRNVKLVPIATLFLGLLWALWIWDSNTWHNIASYATGQGRPSLPDTTQRPLVAATSIYRDRSDIREWIEFHLLAGFDALYVYDFEEGSSTNDVLSHYIDTHRVEYIPWPPPIGNGGKSHDKDIGSILDEQLEECRSTLQLPQPIPAACQSAAYTDGLQRARNDKAEWYTNLDIDEFVYASEAERSLLDVLRASNEAIDIVQLQGAAFGTSGYAIRPPRGYQDLFSSLVTEHNTYRAPLVPIAGDDHSGVSQHQFARRAFSRPHRVSGSSLYSFIPASSSFTIESRALQYTASDSPIRLNQYRYRYARAEPSLIRSSRESYAPFTNEINTFLSTEQDTVLQSRFVDQLRENLQKVFLEHPPLHADDYDPELFTLHPRSQHTATNIPDVCLTVLTCKRIGLVRETVARAIRYMAIFEPDVSFEIVLFDNGSGSHIRRQIENDLPLDKITYSAFNEGLAAGFNGLVFGSCRAPYVLTLEDDWFARVETWPTWAPLVKMGLNILRLDPHVLEVWLRDWHEMPGVKEWVMRNATGWIDVAEENVVSLSNENSLDRSLTSWPRAFQYRKLQPSTTTIWGTFTNGGSLKNREVLRRIGEQKGFDGEGEYMVRVNEADLSSAHICLGHELHYSCNHDSELVALFEHAGTKGRSAGHKDSNET